MLTLASRWASLSTTLWPSERKRAHVGDGGEKASLSLTFVVDRGHASVACEGDPEVSQDCLISKDEDLYLRPICSIFWYSESHSHHVGSVTSHRVELFDPLRHSSHLVILWSHRESAFNYTQARCATLPAVVPHGPTRRPVVSGLVFRADDGITQFSFACFEIGVFL